MNLIGRSTESAMLERAWAAVQRGEPQLAVVLGRRRVGKTFLLSAFAESRQAVFFTATRNGAEGEQMARLSAATRLGLGDRASLAGGGFADLEAALRFFQQISVASPLVVVLDEVTRLASARADLGDIISAVWESPPAGCQLMLVVCSSAVGAMHDLIGPEGGLYRRATLELRLDPLGLKDAALILGEGSAVDPVVAVEAYAACGGYPLHLRAWDISITTDQNLASLAGSPAGLLVRDAVDIMFEDLDARSGYERVLATMGRGPVRRSKIASRAQQRIDQTLAKLRRGGYVEAERPLGAPTSADPLYRLTDVYLRFWFAVLREDADLIDGGQGAAVLRRVAPRWNAHLQAVFEDLARDHAKRLVAEQVWPSDTIIGRWWRDEELEIDVLGLDSNDNMVIVGEAKWQTGPVGRGVVTDLRRKAALLPFRGDPKLVVWTRAPRSNDLAAIDDVTCFEPGDLLA